MDIKITQKELGHFDKMRKASKDKSEVELSVAVINREFKMSILDKNRGELIALRDLLDVIIKSMK